MIRAHASLLSALLILGGALGCNVLFDIVPVDATPADTGIDSGVCPGCAGEGSACVAGKCVDRRWQNGPIVEHPECTKVGGGDAVVLQSAAGLAWSVVPQIAAASLAEAERQCAALSAEGFHDFRVATRMELLALVDLRSARPLESSCTPSALGGQLEATFCSASFVNRSYVYCVEGASGAMTIRPFDQTLNAVCVQPLRGEPRARFERAGDHVYDRVTNLTWQKDIPLSDPSSNQHPRTHEASLDYCRGLGAGWVVPTVKQLQSLVDEARTAYPLIDLKFFPGLEHDWHWTSDMVAGGSAPWRVDFTDGVSGPGVKPGVVMTSGVRCVHPGRI